MSIPKKLNTIVKATGWSQEKLASELSVSFPTLNSWINGKSQPRSKAVKSINDLYEKLLGSDGVTIEEVESAKKQALDKTIKVGEILDSKELLDKLTLYLTYHTNSIEGSTMTLSDVEDVIFDNKVLANRTSIEQAEARNHQAALHWLLDRIHNQGQSFEINIQLINEIHLRLMNGIIADAGKFRNHSVRIMGANVPLANWARIPDKLEGLINNYPNDNKDPIGSIAQFHADFEQIHPFSDGNGRAGRLIMLAQALQKGLVPPVVEQERKQAYYKYLQDAQTKDKYEGIEMLTAESMLYADDFLTK